MWWPLMQTAITNTDKKALIDFIQSSDRYTCGPKVKEFEDAWSEWLGCKHSLYVTSGSTANLFTHGFSKGVVWNSKTGFQRFLVPACTWVTNVSPVFKLG